MMSTKKIAEARDRNEKELKRVSALLDQSPDLENTTYPGSEDVFWTYKVYLNVLIAKRHVYNQVLGVH